MRTFLVAVLSLAVLVTSSCSPPVPYMDEPDTQPDDERIESRLERDEVDERVAL